MKPRGFWRIFFAIAAITALFVYIVSLCMYFIAGAELFSVLRFLTWLGIPFALLNGFVAASGMKSITAVVSFQDKKAFLSRLNVVIAETGYYPESQTESFLTYKPSFRAGRVAGRISVQIDDDSATMVGPSCYIKKLQKWLQ